MTSTLTGGTYAPDRPHEERVRLDQQAPLIEPDTRRMLTAAGIGHGMRVLDVGSGVGDLARLVADVVGPDGRVVSVDPTPKDLRLAQSRASDADHRNLEFVVGDIRDVALDHDFDAAVGRLVLCDAQDPVDVLGAALTHVRADGVAVFQEAEFTSIPQAVPQVPLIDDLARWLTAVFVRTTSEWRTSFRLRQAFLAVGLTAPVLDFTALIGGGSQYAGYEYTAATLRRMLPMLSRLGITSVDDVHIDTFAARLRQQTLARDARISTVSLVSARAIIPNA